MFIIISSSAEATGWLPDSSITFGSGDIGAYSSPTVFQKEDNLLYQISGDLSGNFYGFSWNGSSWVTNNSIISGLTDIGDRSTPIVFQKDNIWYLISGESLGVFYGFSWNGSSWVTNNSIISGLTSADTYSNPTVFQKDNIWYFISGDINGLFGGFSWNGSSWVVNNDIISGLTDVGATSHPAVIQILGTWYLISGETDGVFNGFIWNGVSWAVNNNIILGLEDVGSYSSPTLFRKDDTWYIISGNLSGTFNGFAMEQIPTPYNPINSSILTKSYPPLTSSISFNWSDSDSNLYSNLIISKDIYFNLIAVDTITSNNFSVQSLAAGNYWWKVRYYNSTSGTYGSYSDTFNFTLTNNISTSGTAIQGVVYELVNGVQTPVSGATVYIQHSAGNWSSQMTTGGNGYYLFDGLQNNTIYYIYSSKKDYQNSATEYITTIAGNAITRDILLKLTEPTYFEPDKQYVKFKARWLYCAFSCDIQGATITVFKSGDVISTYSGITDTTGSISFLLYKTQLYRITVTNATAGISQEMTIYPKDTDYIFLITNQPTEWNDHAIPESQGINISVSKSIYDNTHANITVSYIESVGTTTGLKIYINQTNGSAAQIIINSGTPGSPGTYSYPITNQSGQSYLVHIVGTSSEYGTVDRTFAVVFDKIAGMNAYGIPEGIWLWFAVAIMFFTAAVFTGSTAEKGFIIVCAEGWIFLAIGMFSTINVVQFGIGLTVASIIAIMAYIRSSQTQGGYT